MKKQRYEEITKTDGTKIKVTVYELSVAQIRTIIEDFDKMDQARIIGLLAMCTDLSLADVESLYPSDLKKVWDKFCLVNDAFLAAARAAGLPAFLQKLIGQFWDELSGRNIWKNAFAALSSAGTPTPGSTDIHSSWRLSQNPSGSPAEDDMTLP